MKNTPRNLLSYLFIFATGAAGLVYEVTWQKYLSRLLGADTLATAVVLATFLGGLSAGYYLCGRVTGRIRNHLKGYSLVEGAIGGWCLFFPSIFAAVESATRHWGFSGPPWAVVEGLLCSIALMGMPTVCMGATIPFLTRILSETIVEATRVHARVYAVNTAGAFLGTLLAGFCLIPELGLPMTMKATAFVNIGACVFFYLLSIPSESTREATPPDPGDPAPDFGRGPSPVPPRSGAVYLVAFLSGCYVMTLENALIRFANLSLGSSSYTFSLIVAAFVFAIALGSRAVAVLKRIPIEYLFFNQLFIVLSLTGIYISLDTWPYWAHVIRIAFQPNVVGFWGYHLCVLTVLILVLLLPVGLMGATVPMAFHEIKKDLDAVGKHSGRLLALNTLGNLCGSLGGGIALYCALDNAGVFLSAILIAAVSALAAARHLPRRYAVSAAAACTGILPLLVFEPWYSQDNFMVGTFRYPRPFSYSFAGPGAFFREFHKNVELRYYEDEPTATVAVLENRKEVRFQERPMSVIINGKTDSSTVYDIYTLKLLAHLPALLARSREKVMVIGLGTGVTAGELTLYPDVERIDVAEISSGVARALPHFRDYNHGVHEDPRVEIHTGDAFRVIGRSRDRWDIIISEPSNPWVTGVDLLFTREFYRMVKGHLAQGGIFLQWVQVYAFEPRMLGMIVNTLKQEFGCCRVFVGESTDLLILASNHAFSSGDLQRAEETLDRNDRVKRSLQAINLGFMDALLIREIWPPSYVEENFSHYQLQTMDHPRLHYMAGNTFFTDRGIPPELLFGPAASPYRGDFLMWKRHPKWDDFPFSPETYHRMLASLENRYTGETLPIARSVRLKAYLGDPDRYPLSEEEKGSLKVHLLPMIAEEAAWGEAELEGISFRERAGELIDHVNLFRTWIAPYPVNGLEALLRAGMTRARDAYESNWCALQLAGLLLHRRGDRREAEAVLHHTVRDARGNILVEDGDRELLQSVSKRISR